MHSGSDATRRGSDRRVLRPRTIRIAAYAVGAAVLAASAVTMVAIPHFDLGNRLGFLVFGLAVFWFCHREASVRAVAGTETLTIRNLFRTRTLEWAEVLGVRFPMGDPWAHLELSDGTTWPVMALQRTDGRRGIDLARELSALIRERGEGSEPSPDQGTTA